MDLSSNPNISSSGISCDEMETEIPDFVGIIENSQLSDETKSNEEINKAALKALDAFFTTVKRYILKLSEIKSDPSKLVPDFDRPNLAYVPVAIRGSAEDTPVDKQIWTVNSRTDGGLISSPSKSFRGKRKGIEESNLYMKHLNAYFCFPRVLASQDLCVRFADIEFERMIPLIGDGVFGPYGQLFGPKIRTELPIHLILDACTFAVHSLYGLYVLHEMIGYAHGDISPENIMFSPSDDIWKLNDFEHSLPIEKSLKTIRECGTKDFIAPESLKTGIVAKSSDIYALGQVLWRIFHTQIMWMACLYDHDDRTEKAYDDFFESVKLMIKDLPSERPTIISSMNSFNQIIKNNQICDFHIYGSDKLMIAAEKLIESEKDVAEIPFNEITINTM